MVTWPGAFRLSLSMLTAGSGEFVLSKDAAGDRQPHGMMRTFVSKQSVQAPQALPNPHDSLIPDLKYALYFQKILHTLFHSSFMLI